MLVHCRRRREFTASERSDYSDKNISSLKRAFGSFRKKFDEIIREHGPLAAYGAGQRGITLLNLMGTSPSNVVAVFDENPIYHDLFTPQSGIPVRSPAMMTPGNIRGKVVILASSYDEQIREKYKYMGDRFISLSEFI